QSHEIADMAVLVDAKDDAGRGFYEHHGFQKLVERQNRLFLPMKTIEQLFSASQFWSELPDERSWQPQPSTTSNCGRCRSRARHSKFLMVAVVAYRQQAAATRMELMRGTA